MENIIQDIRDGLYEGLYWDTINSLNINDATIFKSHRKEHRPMNVLRDALLDRVLRIEDPIYRHLKQTT